MCLSFFRSRTLKIKLSSRELMHAYLPKLMGMSCMVVLKVLLLGAD